MAKPVKVSNLVVAVEAYSSTNLIARWSAPGKKSGRWQNKRKKGGKYEKKGKKYVSIDCLAGYTYSWTVYRGATYYDSKAKKYVTKSIAVTENSGSLGAGVTSTTFSAPTNAFKVVFAITPTSKKYDKSKDKNKKKEVNYFTGGKATASWNYPGTDVLEKAPTPTVSIENNVLKCSLNNLDSKITSVFFAVAEDDSVTFSKSENTPVHMNSSSYQVNVNPGHKYKVRCRVKGTDLSQSDWSDFTDNVESTPKAPEKLTLKAIGTTSVQAFWDSAGDNYTYDLEWYSKPKVDNPQTFDNAGVSSSQTTDQTNYIVSGLAAGTWYFRLRVDKGGQKSSWYPAKETECYITIGKPPNAPTTYTLFSSIKAGEKVDFYWVHNVEDGSAEKKAEIEFTFKSEGTDPIVITEEKINDSYGKPDAEIVNQHWTIDTSETYHDISFEDGVSVDWRVRTLGVSDGWSPWSAVRNLDIWAGPTLILFASATLGGWLWDPFNFDEDTIYTAPKAPMPDEGEDDIFTSLPIAIELTSGPLNQTPIGYTIQVTSKDSYTYETEFGDTKIVKAGDVIFEQYYPSSRHSIIKMLTPFNIDLEDSQEYTITASVSMNSGLTKTSDPYTFKIDWKEAVMYPNADVLIDPDDLHATIVPYCFDANTDWVVPDDIEDGDEIDEDEIVEPSLVENVVLSVYRNTVDGEFVEIMTDIPNDRATAVVDPHPTLGEVSYRIVAYKIDTGQMEYTNTDPEEVDQPGIVISWDEDWYNTSDVFEYEDENEEDANSEELEYSGVQLKLPFNVDISESNSPDVALVNYIGRRRPVGYFGTQLGETSSWKTEMPKNPNDGNGLMVDPGATLQLLRRLAARTGPVYVRESSGRTGYWAHVTASFDLNHNALTIPISFNVTRIEGGA